MRHDMRERLTGHDVCSDCYMAFHYGPHGAGIEFGETWNRDRFGDTVNSWAEQGYRIYDGVCEYHPIADYDDGVPCVYCGETDPDNGHTVFSKQACETCGALPGTRYRLLVG